ncbi:unnamed protein product [Cuscuta campestris]|uniref:Uncharacterized protein n=1 Tax=Cuscuta campestris TaxID=132261 RepID=A0A484M570_9ASTE|nr:unnamed protein product [Cuscuta campestris]
MKLWVLPESTKPNTELLVKELYSLILVLVWVSSLIAELAEAAAAEKGIVFEEAMEDRLCAYSRAVAHFPTAVKEFQWRNGWFYALSEKALAAGKPDPCPLHTAWLKEINVV